MSVVPPTPPVTPHAGAHARAFSARLLAPRWWPTWCALALAALTLLLPKRARSRLARWAGGLSYRWSHKRRAIAQYNIAQCFPTLSADAQAALVEAHFRVAMEGLFDFPWWWWASNRAVLARVRIEGLAHYEDAQRRGRQVILLTYHNVALEAGVVISAHFPHVSVVKPLKNPVLDWWLTRARCRFGGQIFAREAGMRPLVRAVRAGAGVYYIADEDLGAQDSVFAPFLGVPAMTLATLGRLSELCHADVLPCAARLLPEGRGYVLTLSPPLRDFPTGEAITDATRMNQAIEAGIREAPEQYWWTSKRFKHRPGQAGSPYER